jgi:hypothetical protein
MVVAPEHPLLSQVWPADCALLLDVIFPGSSSSSSSASTPVLVVVAGCHWMSQVRWLHSGSVGKGSQWPDTLFGAAHMVVAPEHLLLSQVGTVAMFCHITLLAAV